MKFLKFAFGLFCASALCLQAAPLQREYVSANTGWFLHLDVDRLKETKIGQHILDELQWLQGEKEVQDLKAAFNFDPAKALHGVTMWGTDTKPDNYVFLFLADFDTNRYLTVLSTNKIYEPNQVRGYKIYSWVDQKKSKKQRLYTGVASGVAVFGQNIDRVAMALDVVRGTEPSLKTSSSFRALGITVKSPMIVGAARPSALSVASPLNLVLKSVDLIALGVGENNGNLEVEMPITSSDQKAAQQLLAADQGLVAMLSFQTNNPVANKILQGLTTTNSGPVVSTTLKLPVSEVLQMIEDAQTKGTNEKSVKRK